MVEPCDGNVLPFARRARQDDIGQDCVRKKELVFSLMVRLLFRAQVSYTFLPDRDEKRPQRSILGWSALFRCEDGLKI